MITDVLASQGKSAKARGSRVPLGLLLLQRGVLTADQLKTALAQQKSATELNFGDVVQQLGFATEEKVTAAVAAQWGCPVFSLGDRRLEIRLRIPRRFLELYTMLPVHYSETERRLLIGFVSGVQHQLLYTIGHVTSCTVAPCFITAREYESHLNSPTTSFLCDHERVIEQIVSPGEMARTISDHVVEAGADRLRMGQCRDYLWVRAWGSGGETDLLFRVQQD